MNNINVEVDVNEIVTLLDKLKVVEKELSSQSQLVYKLFGSCDGDYTSSVDSVTGILYDVLELLGFNCEVLYDWVHDNEFLIYYDGFIYDVTDAESYTLFALELKDLSEFIPCGEYTENEDGTTNKSMYGV